MAGRPRERDQEETILKAKNLFMSGRTQLGVSFARNNTSMTAIQKGLEPK